MFKLADLFVEVGAVTKPLDNTLASVKGRIAALAATRFNIPGGGFAALLGIGAGAAGLTKAISGASDLAETVSKVGAVFGTSSKLVTDAADEMAKAFGIPKREFLDAASQFGLIAEGMGQTKEQAAEMSVKFARLAIDASSFYNVPVADALEKIRAGLTGESEPLKAFGVIMDETTMKSYAVASGLAKKGQELNNTQKLAARAALIEKGLATATGDMARTQDGAANQTRKFWGVLTNLGDTIGTSLLPAFTALIQLMNEVATDSASSAEKSAGAWSGFVDGFKDAIETAGNIYRNFGDIVERTSVMIKGVMLNVFEALSYGPKAMHANVEAMIKSLVTGEKFEFRIPEFKLTDYRAKLDEIDRRILARETKRIDDRADRGVPGNGELKGGPPGNGVAPSNQKYGITDIETYLKEFQEAASGGRDEIARAQLRALEQIARNTEEARDKANKAGPAPVGARWG